MWPQLQRAHSVNNCPLEALTYILYHSQHLARYPIASHDAPQAFSVHRNKGFVKVHKACAHIKIYSVVVLFCLKAACSFWNFLSIPNFVLSSIILQNILLLIVAQITFLEYLDNKALLPHFWRLLRLPKPDIISSQPSCLPCQLSVSLNPLHLPLLLSLTLTSSKCS